MVLVWGRRELHWLKDVGKPSEELTSELRFGEGETVSCVKILKESILG